MYFYYESDSNYKKLCQVKGLNLYIYMCIYIYGMLFRNYILTIANAYRRLLKEKRYMLFKLYFIGACFFFRILKNR